LIAGTDLHLKLFHINQIIASEALSVDDTGTIFFVFFLGDPHVVERAQSAEDGTSDPDREFSFGRSQNLCLENFEKGTLIFMAAGARVSNSFLSLSPMLANMVEPPDNTIF